MSFAKETQFMHPSGNGHWLKETALAPGTYEYCLVGDGPLKNANKQKTQKI
jgi:hypothetical protein